jgi:hypothetical protein
MRSSILAGVILTGMVLAAAGTYAQTLGDVARKEEARRKTVNKPSKVYTNKTLKDDGSPAPPSTASSPASPAPASAAEPAPPATAAAPAAAPAPASPRDEKYWRGRLDATRTTLARAQTVQEALQSRINALSTDFVNRDDPAQRNAIAADRQKALAELDRVKQEITQHQKAIADIQEEGRRAGVPAGWLR